MCSKIGGSLRRGLLGIVLCLGVSVSTNASDIASILSNLEHDPLATADRLLELPPDANQSPSMVSGFIQTSRIVGRQGDWKRSIALLERAREAHHDKLLQQPTNSQDEIVFLHTIDLAIASAAAQCQEHDRVVIRCRSVLQDEQAPVPHLSAAYLMLIDGLRAKNERQEAIKVLQQAIQDKRTSETTAKLAELAIGLGNECLQHKEVSIASVAYNEYLTLMPEGQKVTDAKLGIAWASALGADSPLVAAERLTQFVDQFPQHRDAAHALRASATCFDQANDPKAAEGARQRLLSSYPTSDAATSILVRYLTLDAPWPASARSVWKTRLDAKENPTAAIATDQLLVIFSEALRSSDDPLWRAGVQYLISADTDGLRTDSLLKQATSSDRESLAEHLAVDLISLAGIPSNQPSQAAAESACRWAGSSERWSLLALAADELGRPDGKTPRSLVIDRILAESLMQTQRPTEAMHWWDWLIDDQKANDFSTLLRGAETKVAHGDIETATLRIEAAKLVAGENEFNRALTQMLSAELSIRRGRFDEARESLTSVVRANDASTSLRPRAQWLIGETYFLQQKYADAIDAYRRVDTMDTAGEWAPAALLQAGKAFEKLGRGRDAAVCYTALLTRFRDWPHATLAQSRLATLSPSMGTNEPVLR